MHESDADATHAPTDRELFEQSPSCDTFETAEIYGCPNAHAVEEAPDHDDALDLKDLIMLRDSSPRLEVAQ
jgi:hypothetical protein